VSEQGSAYSRIWTPLRIGSITVKNRIVMTAMTSNYAEDHILSERHIAFYRERAKGGAALMITRAAGRLPLHQGLVSHGLQRMGQALDTPNTKSSPTRFMSTERGCSPSSPAGECTIRARW